MPGTNLTRDEAQERARLLTVDAYEIDLDLSAAQEGAPPGRPRTGALEARTGP